MARPSRRLPGHVPPADRRIRPLLRGGYARTAGEFHRLVGLERIKVFHLNDSKKPCGSRVDRHEHIGKGCLGIEPFRRLLNDPGSPGCPCCLKRRSSIRRRAGGEATSILGMPGICGR